MLSLYNSLTKQKEDFIPYNPPRVNLYACGPTVYDHAHLGHIKKYVGDDILRRVLMFLGFRVKHVQNVTDVGHLESDADEGEDKLEKGSRKYGIDAMALARKFEDEFYTDMQKVNNLLPDIIQRAADEKSIQEQVRLIAILLDKRYAYITDNAIYFDVAMLSDYNPFSNQPLAEKITGSREDVVIDPEKHHPADFALWIFRKGIHAQHVLHWETPWGDGFPGWHIECSAISMQNFGDQIDIHTGGIDHLLVHHPNEIAQNYGVTNHQVVKYWVHHEFMMVDGRKMSKSLGNFITLSDLIEKGYDPLAMRYFVLNAHYRKQINFTWEALGASGNALKSLRQRVAEYQSDQRSIGLERVHTYIEKFTLAIEDDLNTPQSLAVLSEVLHSDLTPGEKLAFIEKADQVWGLQLLDQKQDTAIPSGIKELAQEREQYRKSRNFTKADELRQIIEDSGYLVSDSEDGFSLIKK